jgi:aminoglycoside phosphotransferase (APT) family kinase protein
MSDAAPLDIEDGDALRDYLRRTGRIAPAADVATEVLAGGVSCKTVRVDLSDGRSWVLKQALARLRVRAEWFSDPARIHREAAGLRWLARLAPAGATVDFVFEDFPAHVLAMTAVPGPHANWKTGLLERGPEADHAAQFGRLLGTIHRQALEHATELKAAFGDITFFDQLRLEAYYRTAATNVPAAADFYLGLIADTLANRVTLVHGDYSPKNILEHDGRLVLLDHEVVHWGDPGFDLGFALTHLLAKARHLPRHRDAFVHAAAEFWSGYGDETAGLFAGLEPRAVRHALGCLLARVEGRSPLEYLTPPERAALRADVLAQLPTPPLAVPALIKTITRSAP